MQKELTPTKISSMSEEVAKYMGEWNEPQKYWFGKNSINFLDWNNIHEVWEKVRGENVDNATYKDYRKFRALQKIAYKNIAVGTPLEAFTALYNAIEFINKLKQEK